MRLKFKPQNRVFHIIMRSDSLEVENTQETLSRAFEKSFQSKLMRTVQLNTIFFLRTGLGMTVMISLRFHAIYK